MAAGHLVGIDRAFVIDDCATAADMRHAERYTNIEPLVKELRRWRFAAWFPCRVVFGLRSYNGIDVVLSARVYVADGLPGFFLEQAFSAVTPSRLSMDPANTYRCFLREIFERLIADGFQRV